MNIDERTDALFEASYRYFHAQPYYMVKPAFKLAQYTLLRDALKYAAQDVRSMQTEKGLLNFVTIADIEARKKELGL